MLPYHPPEVITGVWERALGGYVGTAMMIPLHNIIIVCGVAIESLTDGGKLTSMWLALM